MYEGPEAMPWGWRESTFGGEGIKGLGAVSVENM